MTIVKTRREDGSMTEAEYLEANPGSESQIKQLRDEGYLLAFRGVWREYVHEDGYEYVLIHSRISRAYPEEISPESTWNYS